MKILSIEFQNHSILGNLKLDFTDKKGNPVDTIILAGENGCGKTTILEEISNLWDRAKHNASYKGKYITAKIYLDKKEVGQITQKIIEAGRDDIIPINSTGVFVIKSDLATKAWEGFDVKYQQNEILVSINYIFMIYLQPFAQSIFSPVDINYHSQNITSIQATSLDSDKSVRKKSNENLATEINQLLVDAEASDASEALSWIRSNPTQTMPQNLVSPRIKRFSNAFSKMFDDIEFSRVDNVQSIKTIFFKRGNTEIPISKLSSGEKQIVYRGAYLLKDIKLDLGKMILIDEPEISMHPIWQKKILGYYQGLFSDEKGNQLSQIFVATHSPFIIHNDNRHNDKVVVLQKDDNGNITTSDKPEYYDCNSCKAIEDSFAVYDFNEDKKKILFAEDKYIQTYKIAWLKLNNIECNINNFEKNFEDYADFCIYPSEGAGNLAGLLRAKNIDYYKDKKVIGLFDFDTEGVQQFKCCKDNCWSQCQILGDIETGLYKKRNGAKCFAAMLLPIPPKFKEYHGLDLSCNFMELEHLLPKKFLESHNFIEEETLPIPGKPVIYKAKDNKKSEIWKKAFDLTKDDFKNFKILFDTLNQIWSSTDETMAKG